MTPDQIALVQASYQQLPPLGDTAAAIFYGRLFALDPSLRGLFGSDLRAQGRKLATMLTIVVGQLHRWDALAPEVVALGARHQCYGVQAAHYDTVGAALLWTLQQGLGARFTPELRDAWAAVYQLLAATMQEATRDTSRS